MGISGRMELGKLGVGAGADLCVFDPSAQWEFLPENMLSRGRNTPFTGWQFKGRTIMTVFGGNIVYERETSSRKE